jgi:xanthine dehydrogenase small subunit
MADALRFLLNGEPVDVTGASPQTTLLEYLRDVRRLTGTKEGCAEGDCGACTVVLAELRGGALAWRPINACIRLLPSVDGKAIFTVESLQSATGELHPVQRALVDCHGSQCGFCTPGFAMSLFGLYKTVRAPGRPTIEDALSGNLCRCTGYRPIVDAATAMYALPDVAGWRGCGVARDGARVVSKEDERLAEALAMLKRADTLDYAHAGQHWLAPRTPEALAAACAAKPEARIVAGMTDVALAVTKAHRDLGDMIYVGDVEALSRIEESDGHVDVGAAVTLNDALPRFDEAWPELHEAWRRFASVPIRHGATLAGNVANGSPIGDAMPMLLALDAEVVLESVAGRRIVPLDRFYPAYRQTVRAPGEFVEAIRIPKRTPHLLLGAYKIGKRYDQDISAVFACFALTVEDARVVRARIGCGGVAATPVRALRTEAELVNRTWDMARAEHAARVLESEFAPIDDMRASAGYRRRVLGNLLRRFALETIGTSGAPVRIEQLAVAPA